MSRLENKPNQCAEIINYITEHGHITSLDAYVQLGITQLGARIFELKKQGWVFEKKWVSNNGKRYVEYAIAE